MLLKRIGLRLIVMLSLAANVFGATGVFIPMPALQSGSSNPPILLIVNSASANKFGAYLGEILRAEGLNAFDQVELNSLTSTQLAKYDVAILAQTPLSSAQAVTLTNYVSGGGALLAMRPASQITNVFGLSGTPVTLSDGYLQIKTSAVFSGSVPGSGLTSATLQIHGDADQYATSSGVMLAQLYVTATTSTPYSAVVGANYGSGQAVAFTYDLAKNVAYTRQGNPANANLNMDPAVDNFVRTVDLFETADNNPPWIDRDKIPIPQADVQQRLFARLVQQMIGRLHPMPQLWYFPETAKTMLILTSDAHWSVMDNYNALIADVSAHQGNITIYLSDPDVMNPPGNDWDWPTDADLQTWQAQGDTFGIHPWRNTTLTDGFNTADSWFHSTGWYTTTPRSSTVRIHRLEWQGWTDAADIEAAHNLGMDFSFYHWGQWLQKPDGTWPHGYITGSGLPMKFVRTDGTLTSVYQQLTEMADDQLFNEHGGFEGLTGAQAVALSQSLIDASLAGNYSALTDIHHTELYLPDTEFATWLAGDIDYAVNKGVPVWNADQWLNFTQVRHDANFSNIAWNPGSGALSFTIAMTATPGITPTTILPLGYAGQSLAAVTLDGGVYTFTVQTINSTNVAFVSVPAGNHSIVAVYGNSKFPQTITFNPLPDKTYGDSAFTVVATATSSLPVTFTVSGGACSIVGAVVTLTSAGMCPVTAHQSGNVTYDPAPDVTQSFTVTKATPVITWSNPSNIVYGTVLSGAQLNATASVPGSLVYSPSAGTLLNAGTNQVLHVDFTPTDTTNYTVASKNVALTVTKATSVVTWSNPSDIVYGTVLGGTQLNATASVSGSLVYSPSAGTLLNAGNNQVLHVDFTPTDTTDYTTASKNVVITVTKATPVITWSNPSDIGYGTVLGGTQLNATASVSGSLVYSPSAGTLLNAGNNQVLHVDFTPTDTTNYTTVSKNVALTVTKAVQTITFTPLSDKTYGDAAFTVVATATSSLPVTFTVSGTCNLAVATVTLTGAGSCTVTAHQVGNNNYTAALDVAQTFNVAKARPTVSVTGGAFTYDGQPHGGSGFAYGIGGIGDVLNPTVTLTYNGTSTVPVAAGVYGVVGTFVGNSNYLSATNTATLTISQAVPVLMWSNPSDIVYGTVLGGTQLNATASVSGSLVYSPPAGTLLPAGNNQVLHVDFTPTDTTNYTVASKNVALTVTKATPVLTWSNPSDIVYGTVLGGTQLNATASVSGSLVYSPSAGTLLPAGTNQVLHVDFTPTDTTNYTTVSKNVALTVTKATPVITWSNPSNIVYGTVLSGAQLNATASVPGSLVYSPSAGTLLNAGTNQVLHVDFTPTDTTNYTVASKNVALTVTKATSVVTWSNPSDIVYGTVLGGTQLNATASVSGSLVYSPSAGTLLNAGNNQVLHVDFTPTDTTDYTTASKNVVITVTKATPVITWSNPSDIGYGTVLGGTQLNATASVSGSLVYSPSAGTLLNAGNNQVLHVDFTPTDTTNYTTVSKNVALTVTKAVQTITFTPLSDKTYGDAAFTVVATATSSLPVTFTVSGTCNLAVATVTLTGAGSCTVTAHQVGNNNYTAALDVAQTFNVAKARPTVSVTGGAFTYDGQPHGGSGFAYGIGGIGDVLNPTVTLTYNGTSTVPVAAGVYGVVGTFVGNSNYLSATNTATLTISQAVPVLMWSNPSDIVYGTVLGGTQLNATASVSGSLVYSPPAGTLLPAGNNQVLHVDFTPTDTTNYTVASKNVALTVTKATPVLTWSNPSDIVYGTVLGGTQLNATASVSGSLVYSPSAGTLLPAGTNQVLHVDFTPTDTTNYTTVSKNVALTVTKATQTITFTPLPDKIIGDPSFTVVATATSSLSIIFTAGGDCSIAGNTVMLVKAGSCRVTAHQAGNANYQAALDVTQTFAIQRIKVFLALISKG